MTSRSRRGFTLIELVLVAAIVSILSAVAIPRYASSLANYRADAAARRILADIQLAQARARALSAQQTITFSTTQHSYQIAGYADPDLPSATYTVSLRAAPYSARLTTASFGGSATLTLNGFGLPATSGTLQVQSGAAVRTLTINAQTGTVTIP
jgi:prepilin-type N-terminal cleavage/methylation domain-containing protein